MKKRFLVGILTGLMLIGSVSVSASASYSDIEGHWGKTYIQAMANKGAIKGYEDGTFRPDQTILKSEFLAIAIRSTFPDYDKSDSSTWWANEYNTALAKGIITEYEMSREVMDTNITREEMTMIMVRCVEAKGESLYANYTGVASTIKDYMNTGEYYRTYVVKAYTSGLIQGKENNNFDPQGVATRAESATVLYRLENKDARTPVQFVTGGGSTSEDLSAPITIYEGQERTNRLAKEGDTVVKADGTKVVLKKGPNGVLGEGQGVAPDLGFTWNYKGWIDVVRNNESFDGGSLEGWEDSVGENIVSNTYYVNPLTGEGHWASEWSSITMAEKKVLMQNDIQGKADGELSPQGNYIWHKGKWVDYIANQYLLTDYYPNLLK